MKKIKVINILGPIVIGGCENMVYELGKALDPQKVDNMVISIGSRTANPLEKKIDEAGINIVYSDCKGTVTLSKLLKVYRIMKTFQPDVLHAHMSGVVYSLPWLMTHRCKMVVTAHTTPNLAFDSRVTKILKILARLGKVVMVGVSEENANLMRSYYQLSDDYVKWVNNGIDISRYYKKDHSNITFVHIGRLDENKNQQLIISCFAKVFEQHPDARLILCGDGPTREKLEDQVRTLGLQEVVTFTGNVSNVQDYLAISDIYLQSSHREGLPLSVVEGMATALPVISTNVGGMKNVVKDNGFLIEDNDVQSYLNAMIRLYEDGNLRKLMGLRSCEMTKPFSSAAMADQYASIYESIIDN